MVSVGVVWVKLEDLGAQPLNKAKETKAKAKKGYIFLR